MLIVLASLKKGQGFLHQLLNNFLLSYRNIPHSTTKTAPAALLLKRQLLTKFDLLKPPRTKDIVLLKQQAQVERYRQRPRERIFHPGDPVLSCNYNNRQKWVPATVIAQTSPVSYTVRITEDIVWRRYAGQLLPGSTALEETSPACAEPFKQVSSAQTTLTQDRLLAIEPVSTTPASSTLPETELSPPPTKSSVPTTTSLDL